MQNIWARAVQLGSRCRCPSCFSHANASASPVTRRVGSAASRGKFRYGDVMTGCYSTIIATATILDSKYKQARRNELDRMIDETTSDINDLRRQNEGTSSIALKESATGTGRASNTWREKFLNAGSNKRHDEAWCEAVMLVASDFNQERRFKDGSHARSSNWGSTETLSTLADGTENEARRHRHSFWQLMVQERSVAHLVASILLLVRPSGLVDIPAGLRSTGQDQAWKKDYHQMCQRMQDIKDLLSSKIHAPQNTHAPNLPRYWGRGAEPCLDEGRELNKSIRRHLDDHNAKKAGFELTMAKICYNLLVSTTPPNTDTYNLLIITLTRLRRNDLVRLVIRSLLESRITPTDVTISAIVNFYAKTFDKKGLTAFLQPMRGEKLDLGPGPAPGWDENRSFGLGFARNPVDVKEQRYGREADMQERMCVKQAGKLVSLAPRNQVVFGALIACALRFQWVRQAKSWLRDMLRQGYPPNLYILTSLLKACLVTLDWRSALVVWDLVNEIDVIDARAYAMMLNICKSCEKQREFKSLSCELQRLGLTIQPHSYDTTVSTAGQRRPGRYAMRIKWGPRVVQMDSRDTIPRSRRLNSRIALGLNEAEKASCVEDVVDCVPAMLKRRRREKFNIGNAESNRTARQPVSSSLDESTPDISHRQPELQQRQQQRVFRDSLRRRQSVILDDEEDYRDDCPSMQVVYSG
ncbi:MAG: hypothetical protein M1825_002498 [Sarcosagium campestre]|nr:MAG: hypothetical protein M1825_002498 [Sarcosagium campestre]